MARDASAESVTSRATQRSQYLCVRIQQGIECLAEFAFRNAFLQQLLKCLAPIRRHGFAMHLGVIGEHVRADTARGQGGRLAFRPPCLEHMKRFGTAGMLHAPHRGSRHWSGLPLISKTWRFCATGAAWRPHRYGNRSRSGAGAAGARLDWLCGRWALHSQRLLVLQQKMLDTGVFCLVYLGLLNRRRPVHSRLNPKADFGNATVTGLQTPCQQCSVLPAV